MTSKASAIRQSDTVNRAPARTPPARARGGSRGRTHRGASRPVAAPSQGSQLHSDTERVPADCREADAPESHATHLVQNRVGPSARDYGTDLPNRRDNRGRTSATRGGYGGTADTRGRPGDSHDRTPAPSLRDRAARAATRDRPPPEVPAQSAGTPRHPKGRGQGQPTHSIGGAPTPGPRLLRRGEVLRQHCGLQNRQPGFDSRHPCYRPTNDRSTT